MSRFVHNRFSPTFFGKVVRKIDRGFLLFGFHGLSYPFGDFLLHLFFGFAFGTDHELRHQEVLLHGEFHFRLLFAAFPLGAHSHGLVVV